MKDEMKFVFLRWCEDFCNFYGILLRKTKICVSANISNEVEEVNSTKLALLVVISIVALTIALGVTVPCTFGSVSSNGQFHSRDIDNRGSFAGSLLLVRPLGDPVSNPTPNHK